MVSSYDILNTVNAQNAAYHSQVAFGQRNALAEAQQRATGIGGGGGYGGGYGPPLTSGGMPGGGMMGGMPGPPPFMPGIPPASASPVGGGGASFYHPSVGSAVGGALGFGAVGQMSTAQFGYGASAMQGAARQQSAQMAGAGVGLALPSLAHHVGTPLAQLGAMMHTPFFMGGNAVLPGVSAFQQTAFAGASFGQKLSRGMAAGGEMAHALATSGTADFGSALGRGVFGVGGQTAGRVGGVLGRGAFAMGRGAAGLAGGLVPQMAMLEGIAALPRQVYQGAADYASFEGQATELGQMLQPFGGSGSRGQGFSRSQVKSMYSSIRGMAAPGGALGEEGLFGGSTSGNVDSLMSVAGQLVGQGDISSASSGGDFVRQFKRDLSRVKNLSKILRQSVDEAASVFSEYKRAGFTGADQQVDQALFERGMQVSTGMDAGGVGDIRVAGASTGRQVLGGRRGARIGARSLMALRSGTELGLRSGALDAETVENLGGSAAAAETMFGFQMGVINNLSPAQLTSELKRMGMDPSNLSRDQMAQQLAATGTDFTMSYARRRGGGDLARGLGNLGVSDPSFVRMLEDLHGNRGAAASQQALLGQQALRQDALDASSVGTNYGAVGKAGRYLGRLGRDAVAPYRQFGASAYQSVSEGVTDFLDTSFGSSTVTDADLALVNEAAKRGIGGGGSTQLSGDTIESTLMQKLRGTSAGAQFTGNDTLSGLTKSLPELRKMGLTHAAGGSPAGWSRVGGTSRYVRQDVGDQIQGIRRAREEGAHALEDRLGAGNLAEGFAGMSAGSLTGRTDRDRQNNVLAQLMGVMTSQGLHRGDSQYDAVEAYYRGDTASRRKMLADRSSGIQGAIGLMSQVNGGALAGVFDSAAVPSAVNLGGRGAGGGSVADVQAGIDRHFGVSKGRSISQRLAAGAAGTLAGGLASGVAGAFGGGGSSNALGGKLSALVADPEKLASLARYATLVGDGSPEAVAAREELAGLLGPDGAQDMPSIAVALRDSGFRNAVIGAGATDALNKAVKSARAGVGDRITGIGVSIAGATGATKTDLMGVRSALQGFEGQTGSVSSARDYAATAKATLAKLAVSGGDFTRIENEALRGTALGGSAQRLYDDMHMKPAEFAEKFGVTEAEARRMSVGEKAGRSLKSMDAADFLASGGLATDASVATAGDSFVTFAQLVQEIAAEVAALKAQK